MKTQTKIIVPVVIIGSVLSFLVFKTDNTKNIEVTTSKNQVMVLENNISSKTENISENKTEELLSESETTQNIAKTSSGEISEETSEPKEVSVVAEDILYPEEYDFKVDISPEMINVGFPIKVDLKPFTNLKEGDTLDFSFGEHVVTAEVYDYQIEEDNDSKYIIIKGYINPDMKDVNNNSIWITLHYFNDGEIFSKILLEFIGGDYEFRLRDNLGYYYDVHKLDEEYLKQEN